MSHGSRGLKVVFICSGNICRSPMAKAIADRLFAEEGIPLDSSESVGILGINRQPASGFAIDVLREIGLDLTQHRSQGLSTRHLEEADYLVAMAPEHVREVFLRNASAESRIVRLWEHTNQKGRLARIEDPINREIEDYVVCRNDLMECLKNWVRQLKATQSSEVPG